MMGKKRGLFGAIPMPGVISGYGGGTWNMDGTQATPVDRGGFEVPMNGGPSLSEAAPPPKTGVGDLLAARSKPGFNDVGGWGEKLALIGSVLTGDGGNSPALQPFMLRRQMELQQQRAQQQRQAELEDYATKLRMKQQYDPSPGPQPYRWESNDGDVYELGQDGMPRRVFDDPTPKMSFIPDGMGGGQWIAVPSAPTGQPQIGTVMDDPRKAGGPTPRASGGFR